MDADGSNLRAITADERRSFGSPVWSPDGKSIAYDAWPSDSPFWDSHVFTSALDGSDERDRGPGAMPEWTPDNAVLLLHTYPLEEGRIVAVSLIDGSRRDVLDHQASNPRLSSDGKKMAAVDRDVQIVVWDITRELEVGMRALMFATNWTPLTGMSWSPDNRRLACVRPRRNAPGTELVILSVNVDAQPLLPIASGDIYRVVAWHPSKNTILFSVREQDGEPLHFRLFDFDAKETYVLPNQHPALQCLDMCWSRDGKRILFVGEKDE